MAQRPITLKEYQQIVDALMDHHPRMRALLAVMLDTDAQMTDDLRAYVHERTPNIQHRARILGFDLRRLLASTLLDSVQPQHRR